MPDKNGAEPYISLSGSLDQRLQTEGSLQSRQLTSRDRTHPRTQPIAVALPNEMASALIEDKSKLYEVPTYDHLRAVCMVQ